MFFRFIIIFPIHNKNYISIAWRIEKNENVEKRRFFRNVESWNISQPAVGFAVVRPQADASSWPGPTPAPLSHRAQIRVQLKPTRHVLNTGYFIG